MIQLLDKILKQAKTTNQNLAKDAELEEAVKNFDELMREVEEDQLNLDEIERHVSEEMGRIGRDVKEVEKSVDKVVGGKAV